MSEPPENTVITVLVQVDRDSQIMAGVVPTPSKHVGLDLSKLTERQRKVLTLCMGEKDAAIYALSEDGKRKTSMFVWSHPVTEESIAEAFMKWADQMDAYNAKKAKEDADKAHSIELGREELAEIAADIVANPRNYLREPWMDCFNDLSLKRGALPSYGSTKTWIGLSDLPQNARDVILAAIAEVKAEKEAEAERLAAEKKAQEAAREEAIAAERQPLIDRLPEVFRERIAAGFATTAEVEKALRRMLREDAGFSPDVRGWKVSKDLEVFTDAEFIALRRIKQEIAERLPDATVTPKKLATKFGGWREADPDDDPDDIDEDGQVWEDPLFERKAVVICWTRAGFDLAVELPLE
jgi:hypothetical protein